MEPAERHEVTQLLEFSENTAAGRMTTEFISVSETAVVDDAIEALKHFEGSREALATIYLTGAGAEAGRRRSRSSRSRCRRRRLSSRS